MANSWLRLWHEMPNDPKWRTIARASKQPITSVISVYLHILVAASNATERGRTHGVCSEDIASALDLECEQVELIISAMQGRVLDGDQVSGWAKRQVEREDGSAERSRAWREARKNADLEQPNANERKRTHLERKRTPDTDTDTDTDTDKSKKHVSANADDQDKKLSAGFAEFWSAYPRDEGKAKAFNAWKAKRIGAKPELVERIIADVKKRKAMHRPWLDGFVPHATTYINGERWEDQITTATQQRAPPAFASKSASAIMQLQELKNAIRERNNGGFGGGINRENGGGSLVCIDLDRSNPEDVLPGLGLSAAS